MTNVLQQFQVGQKVCVKELGSGCHVKVIPNEQEGPVVVEVDPEYIVLDDDAAGIKTRIPVHLISVGALQAEPVPAAA